MPDQTCLEVRRWILKGETDAHRDASPFSEHLRNCRRCRTLLVQWEQIEGLLRTLPRLHAGAEEREKAKIRYRHAAPVLPIACSAADRMIWDWVDGLLDEEEWSSLSAHFSVCDQCLRKWHVSHNLDGALATLPRLEASAAKKQAIKARLTSAKKGQTAVTWTVRAAVGLGLAYLLFLVAVGWKPRISSDRTAVLTHPSVVLRSPIAAGPEQTASTPPSPVLSPQTEGTVVTVRPSTVPSKVRTAAERRPLRALPLSPRRPVSKEKPVLANVAKMQSPQVVTETMIAEKRTGSVVSPVNGVGTKEPAESEKEPMEEPLIVQETPKTQASGIQTGETEKQPGRPITEQEKPVLIAREEKTEVLAPEKEPVEGGMKPMGIVTVERDWSVLPPRITFSLVPSSQRLYERYGVALKVVSTTRERPRVQEPLSPEPPIAWSAERYRSRTATVPIMQLGVSW